MKAPFVDRLPLDRLLGGDPTPWRAARAETLSLEGTPLGMQPTALIRASWKDRPIGAVGKVSVAAVHDGRHLAFRLEWRDATENRRIIDNQAFPDAAAVLLPVVENAPVYTMGAPDMPVNAWYWRADETDHGRSVVAEGIGTSRTVDRTLVRTRGEWKEGRWQVVMARALRVESSEPHAQLEPGATTGLAVAVWDGQNGERAGIKAWSGHWRELHLEAPPTARRR